MFIKINLLQFGGEMEGLRRIQQVALDHGFELTLTECGQLWEKHSDDWCAGWLSFPESDDDLWAGMEGYIAELSI